MPAGAVSVTLPPVQNVVGPEAVIVARGGAVTGTVMVLVPGQPIESVTTTVSDIEPAAPAVNDTELLFAGPTIVPLAIDHE